MDATPVDPRDVSWEVDSPAFRVYFWQRVKAPAVVVPELAGRSSEEWRLTGARDVHEVLEWAALRVGDRSYTLHVEVDTVEGRGLIRLAGADPTRSETR